MNYRIFFLSAFFLTLPLLGHGATVTFSPEIVPTGTSTVSIRIDTEGESINTLEGVVVFPVNTVKVLDVHDGDSFVGFWVEPLSFSDEEISFSGVIPGGFSGVGTVAKVSLFVPVEGEIVPEVRSFSAFKNDGSGTAVPIVFSANPITISAEAVAEQGTDDTIPPEPFSVGIVDVPVENGETRAAAIFATRDRESGIDRYEIQETLEKTPSPDAWVLARSPYILQDQSRESRLFVRAFDVAGNVRDGVVVEENQGKVWEMLFLGVVVLFFFIFFLVYVRHGARLERKKNTFSK